MLSPNGEVIIGKQELREYAEKLFKTTRLVIGYGNGRLFGLTILKSKIDKALRTTKRGEAPEEDEIQAEIIKQVNVKVLT